MKMIYKSKFGEFEMSGSGGIGFSICEVDGTELLGRERSLVKFYNTDGYSENGAFFGQRVITVSGDIKKSGMEEIDYAMRVLSSPGTLIIENGKTAREIMVNDAVFKTAGKNGIYKTFCVQMSCDMPHFTDCSDTFAGIYSRENLITSNTVLPAIFTKRSVGGIVKNDGDVICEPKIIIECLEDATEDGKISIINKTTEKSIIINYTVKEGEIITVDIPERVILSSIRGDITAYLDYESSLSDMYLECGENDFEVIPADGNRNCEVYVVYRNKYVGMVV